MKPSRALARLAVAAVTTLALTGCIKLDMALDVNADNTVDGTMVFAVSKQLSELPGFDADQLAGQGPLDTPGAGDVTTKPYDDGTWVGTEMEFTDVPLSEFGGSDGGDDLAIVRDGDQFRVSGTMDLSGDDAGAGTEGLDMAALTSSAEIRISLTFPGDVVSANGAVDGRTVTWTPGFGETVDLQAVANAQGGGSSTTWLVAGALLVGLLAVGGFLLTAMRRKNVPAPVPAGSIVPGAPVPGAPVAADELVTAPVADGLQPPQG
jgi:hypothetical protein